MSFTPFCNATKDVGDHLVRTQNLPIDFYLLPYDTHKYVSVSKDKRTRRKKY